MNVFYTASDYYFRSLVNLCIIPTTVSELTHLCAQLIFHFHFSLIFICLSNGMLHYRDWLRWPKHSRVQLWKDLANTDLLKYAGIGPDTDP